jgi:glutamyl-tRNA reductase
MRLSLVGVSHRRAPVELRERVALDPARAGELAKTLAAVCAEAVCLSTCNRTELYLAHEDAEEAESRAIASLDVLSGPEGERLFPALYRLRDQAAALHLFRVAAGLDSMVPGEGEILGQVRLAYEAGSCGPVLDRLFRQALHAGKKVRTETAIAESPSSVSSAAAALAQQVFGDLDGCRVLLVGAGEVSELAARSLAKRGASISAVTSRTQQRATYLAERFGGRAVPFGTLADELEQADVVVSSTSSPDQVVSRDLVRDRKGRPLFVIDLAVPRDVDPEIAALDDCYLYDIDDLEAVVSESMSGRWREAERAESITTHEAERFRDWQASRDVVPAIA